MSNRVKMLYYENIIEGYMIDYTYKIRYKRNQSRIIVIFEVQ